MLDVCWIVWTSYKLGADLAEEWTLLAPILPRLLNSRLALTRLAILNTWNNNTKTEVASRNNVVHESVLTPRILQRMPMPMVERHVQACLNFSLSFCLRVRAVAWRHSNDKSVKRWNAAARLYSVAMAHIPCSTERISS